MFEGAREAVRLPYVLVSFPSSMPGINDFVRYRFYCYGIIIGYEFWGRKFMKFRSLALLGSAAVTLASCGGGSSSGSDPVTVPGGGTGGTPSPTPTPTGPDYPAFAELAGSQSFEPACAFGYDRSDEILAYPNLVFEEGLTIAYDADTRAWSIDGGDVGVLPQVTFGPDDLDAESADGTINFSKVGAGGMIESLSIGSGSFADVQLDYVRTAIVRYEKEGGRFIGVCTFGVPTLTDDLPGTSAFTYDRLHFVGAVKVKHATGVKSYDVSGSEVVMGVDRDAPGDEISSFIQLLGREIVDGAVTGAQVDLGQLELDSGLYAPNGDFKGQVTSRDWSDYAYVLLGFGGWFFGPQASEMGYAVSYQGVGYAAGDIQVTGVVVGAR